MDQLVRWQTAEEVVAAHRQGTVGMDSIAVVLEEKGIEGQRMRGNASASAIQPSQLVIP